MSAASGGSYWYHTLWSTCGTTLCTAEIDAATGCAGDKAYMRHGDDGCGCGSGVVCACGDGSVAGGGVGAPLHAHYVRGCAWECDGGFERDATGNACIESSPPPPPPPPPPQPRYTCDATGDPHYNTFFNVVHHFYGKGLFEHARFCTPTCGGCEVSIQTFLGPSAGNSLIKAIAARICGVTFEFLDGDRVTIGGQTFPLVGPPSTVWGPNGCGTSLEREVDNV